MRRKLGERECENRYADCKTRKRKDTERCFLRGEMWKSTAYILIIQQTHIYRMDYRRQALCVQIILQILENQEIV